MENWLPVVGFEGLYEVSDLGRVRSLDMYVKYKDGRARLQKGRILRPGFNAGYPRVNLAKDGVKHVGLVHRLVAIAHIPNPDNLIEVNHKKGIKTDARATELEWTSGSGNMKHAFRTGLNNGPAQNFKSVHKKDLKTLFEKPVNKLDDSGNVIESFESIAKALTSLVKKTKDGNIPRAIKNNYKAYGYKWQYIL